MNKTPYKTLGKYLRDLRTRANESLAEVSGAVEIDVRELAGYELGKSRPSEDVLLLLISHFGAKDDEAVQLWDMAGYGKDKVPVLQMANSDTAKTSNQSDNKILYTDVVDIMVNNYGVVMNFMQAGPANSAQPVVRIGMSRDHARSILQILQTTLNQTQQNPTYQSPDNSGNQTKN